MKKNLCWSFALIFIAATAFALTVDTLNPTYHHGEVTAHGIADDGEGKIVCVKSDKAFGTCADGSVGVNGCPGNCE